MPDHSSRLLVTGASGQLGQLVIDHLLTQVPASRIVATMRSADAGKRLAALGVEVRVADYADPTSLDAAFIGIDRILLISSNALGQRGAQHRHVIEAAKRANASLLAYTSVLHADRSPLSLAADHRETEADIRASGLPFVLLRNGWYTENYTAAIPAALAHNALLGGAGEGRIASAARADYAIAAATVLASTENLNGRVFELAGDDAYTLAELAAEITRQAGRQIGYVNLPEADHRAALAGAGLPAEIAALLANSDAAAANGALFDDSHQLGALIGRRTTPMAATVTAALAKA